jgi:hypothetical protein
MTFLPHRFLPKLNGGVQFFPGNTDPVYFYLIRGTTAALAFINDLLDNQNCRHR